MLFNGLISKHIYALNQPLEAGINEANNIFEGFYYVASDLE
jgi:hypothetical protein